MTPGRCRLVALLVGFVMLVTAGPAAARTPLLIGVQDNPVFVRLPSAYGGLGASQLITAQQGYRQARALGAQVIRITITWSSVIRGPLASEQDWSYYDSAIASARQQGFIVQLALAGSAPAFATGNHRVGVDRPNANDFGRFAQSAASRYRGEVSTYSIWNEPNWWDQLQPDLDAPTLYRRLYESGYAAIKHADPHAQVLIGEMAPMGPPEAAIPPLDFLRDMACRRPVHHGCKPLLAEGFALHPYTLRWQPSFPGNGVGDITTGSLSRLVRALNRLARDHALSTPRGRPLDIYLTEYGWYASYQRIPESLRMVYAPEGFTLAFRQPRVKEIVWYQLAPPPRPNVAHIWSTALLTSSGGVTPTFRSLQDWIRRMRAVIARGDP